MSEGPFLSWPLVIEVCASLVVFPVIAVAIPIPTMVVLDPAMPAVPISGKIALPIVMRSYPVCPAIGRTRPIAGVPFVVTADGIPITFHP